MDYKQRLEDMYSYTNSHLIEYTNTKSQSATTLNPNFATRVELIKKHVENRYNTNGNIVEVKVKQEKASVHNRYCISHARFDKNEYTVFAYGEQKSLNYLFSLCHEVGHLIDFSKRGIDVAFKRDRHNEIEKEVKAWTYGFRFAFIFGYMSREEIELGFPDAMLSLATYYKYHRIPFEEFLVTVEQIKKEVFA